MATKAENEPYFPFPVPDSRFQEQYGYRKLDFALRNAAWNIEYGFAFGNMCSNEGLYSWTNVSDKVKRFIEKDGPVVDSPEVNARNVKKAARFLGADLVGICHAHPNLIYSHELNLLKMEHRPLRSLLPRWRRLGAGEAWSRRSVRSLGCRD
jgi:hypothetical protein